MKFVRLRKSDSSWTEFTEDWTTQCQQVGDDFCTYANASLGTLEKFAGEEAADNWAIALHDDERVVAVVCAIRTTQKGYVGKVLRMREVVVCPLLDYGEMPEIAYSETLIGLLFGAVKLSESGLRAKHIKMHLRSPEDSKFFRAIGNSLDNKGVFESTETHGAWFSVTKRSALKAVS